jgi:hypothetical protein
MDLKVKPTGFDCGCETRAETIGPENWWTLVTVGSAVLILALTYGGAVTAQTKSVLKIAAAGAVVAVFANKIVKAP